MGWDMGVVKGLGVPENKLKVVGGRIEINLKRVGWEEGGMRKLVTKKKLGDKI